MKTHISYILIIGALVVIIILLRQRAMSLKREADSYASALVEKDAEIKYRITKEGRLLASKEAAEILTRDLAKAYPKVVEEMKKEFDIKIKDMKAYVRNEFEARGSGNSTVNHYVYSDSLGRKYPRWELKASDGYLDFKATVYDSLNAPYQYVYSDTATTVIHSKKSWLFGKEKLYSSTVFKNPDAKVIGTTNILIKNYRDKRWVISAGVSYSPIDNKVMPSVGVGYALIKF